MGENYDIRQDVNNELAKGKCSEFYIRLERLLLQSLKPK